MKAKLIVNNQEIEVEISEEEYKKLQPRKTGYERVKDKDTCYIVSRIGRVESNWEQHSSFDNMYYGVANYYSDKTVAENNARADKLMRQLRRFAVEHRETEIDWNNTDQCKYVIQYDRMVRRLDAGSWRFIQPLSVPYFDSIETAQLAIDTFHDELIWYFTEYKDSL